jgi:hypothetical protein
MIGPAEAPVVVFELKVGPVAEVLYDVFKLSSQLQRRSVEAAFSVVAASPKSFAPPGQCSELFAGALWVPHELDSFGFFERNQKAWRNLCAWRRQGLRKSRGRPVRVPQTIRATLVASEPAAKEPNYAIRAIGITGRGGSVEFDGDWPVGLVPEIDIGPDPWAAKPD